MVWQPGPFELILVLAIVILIFGGKRLREVAKGAGEAVKEFKVASSESEEKKVDEKDLVEAAKKMGIVTEGKTLKEILREMNLALEKKDGAK